MANLPPVDAFGYFRVKETRYVVVGSPQVQKIVSEAPSRVELIVGFSAVGQLTSDANAGALQGIPIAASVPYIILTQRDNGSLAQIAWYENGLTAGAIVTTIEVFVDNWPRPQGANNDARQAIPIQSEQDDCD